MIMNTNESRKGHAFSNKNVLFTNKKLHSISTIWLIWFMFLTEKRENVGSLPSLARNFLLNFWSCWSPENGHIMSVKNKRIMYNQLICNHYQQTIAKNCIIWFERKTQTFRLARILMWTNFKFPVSRPFNEY